eukprot:CAMPEP_0171333602 /NCGR_PEP_ID=MMETSP0878-20121228/4101_1 /TAXON_ID=67004 /ORGANISM="Thalassiosira weissflogii, Strain CCMP1336" /LENGTH=327 /DNA_ID=CAMNT_0011834549 /DNA_START=81 /DNA_END=1064 /DNA_ORIENTATION=+
MRKIIALIYIVFARTLTSATPNNQQSNTKKETTIDLQNFVGDVLPLRSSNRTDVHCDIATEETCYSNDGNYTPEYCAKLSEGGCPCDSDEVKCGYGKYSSGYCTSICCDPLTEETCYDGKLNPVECKKFGEGGCGCSNTKKKKQKQVRCGFSKTNPGYCADVCCDEITEETCMGDDDGVLYCAKYSEGGCPCEDDDDVKCGYSEYFPGYCTKVCCDPETEQTCYDSNWNPLWCAKIAWGGCPCPDGQVKCGSRTSRSAGFCTDICCDFRTEEICSDENFNRYCAPISNGGCPCPEGQEKCSASENYAGYCVDIGTCPGSESVVVNPA